MNLLDHNKKIEVITALCEGLGHRAISRITGVNRGTIASLALRTGLGCAALHDRSMAGVRTVRLELDELWSFVGCKQRQVRPVSEAVTGDQYTYVAMAGSSRAIISYLTGKRTSENTDLFIQDLRQRVIGTPEISTDGFLPYRNAIRDAFGGRAAHGTIVKTYDDSQPVATMSFRRYSITKAVANGLPVEISTSYVERSHLTLRQSCRRFARLSNGFSKRMKPHCAAIALYVMFYNFCRIHEGLKCTPAMALGIAKHPWTIDELILAATATQPITPVPTAPARRKLFQVIQGGKV